MRRSVAALVVSAAIAATLTGCVLMPPGDSSFFFAAPYDPSIEYDGSYVEEDLTWMDDYVQETAAGLRALGSPVAPAAGEPLAAFNHVALGVGWEWCDVLWQEHLEPGDTAPHAEQAEAYGWTAEEYGVIATAAERHLCGH